MKITCSHCDVFFNLPDEKLPTGKVVAFPCPECKSRIELDLRSGAAAACAGDAQPPPSPAPAAPESDAPEELKARVLRNLNELPPMPQIVFKALEIIDDPESDTKQVADLIETDPAMATKVLKMANSAYYGMSGKVSSIQHASVVIGYKSLGELITLAATASLLGNRLHGYDMDSGALWHHSLSVAFGSKFIAQHKKSGSENNAFSAGLIHDVGKLILDRPVLNRKKRFDEFLDGGGKTFFSAEKNILGFDHAEIGYDICQHWKIPETLARAIRYHHDPFEDGKDELIATVFMADTIAHMAESMAMAGVIESGLEAVMYMVDDDAMEYLGLEEDDLAAIIRNTMDAVDQISTEMLPN